MRSARNEITAKSMLPGTSLILAKQGRSPMYLYFGLIAQAFFSNGECAMARQTNEPRL